jgi:phosphatidylethanolamine/phosphatidyl-N-methylethanolamine N-methyltransferase
MMAFALNNETVTKTYGRWAPVYDVVFGAIFDRARQAAVAASEEVGGRILEVGVGTGISLGYYSEASRVWGIDLSARMLSNARKRVYEQRMTHVEGLSIMDAERLDFPNASFDVIMAQYVVNTVPHPDIALDEFARVVRPGGEIILVNRVGADAGPRYMVERLINPVAHRLGWRSEFPWDRFSAWLDRHKDIRLIERRPMPPFGHFSLIRFGKVVPGPGASRADSRHSSAYAQTRTVEA